MSMFTTGKMTRRRKKIKEFIKGNRVEIDTRDGKETFNPSNPNDRKKFVDTFVSPFVYEVLRRVKTDTITESTARFYLKHGIGSSNEAMGLIVEALRRIGASSYLLKPIWSKLYKKYDRYVMDFEGTEYSSGTNETKRKEITSDKGQGPVKGKNTVEDAQRPVESDGSDNNASDEDGRVSRSSSGSGTSETTDSEHDRGDSSDGSTSSTSGSGGSASDSGGDGTGSSAKGDSKTGGDPLLLATGQFHNRTTDLAVAGRGLSFSFTRTYLSGATYEGPLGHNWDHNYNLWLREERHVAADGTPQNVVYRSSGDLREDPYVQRLDEPTGDLDPLDQWQDATFDSPPGYFDRLEKSGGTFVLETVNGLRYEYNDENYIDRIVDPNGNELTFNYDDNNRLVSVTDPVGKEFRFEYDDRNRIEWLVDITGDRRIHYEYGDNGDLIEVDQHFEDRIASTDYRYSGPNQPRELQHNLREIINASGETIHENEYGTEPGSQAFNRVVRQWSRDGEYHYEYDIVEDSEVDPGVDPVNAAQQETRVTYPNGHVVAHQFNYQGNVVRRRESVRRDSGTIDTIEATYRYDEDAQLIEETLADGSRTEYVYARELYAETHGGTVAGATPTEELSFGNLRSKIRHPRPGLGESRTIVTDQEYHDRSAVAGERVKSVYGPYYANQQGAELPDQAVGKTTFGYDSDGNLLTIQPPDVEQPDGSTVTPTPKTFRYDAYGQVTDVHDGGVHTRYEYFNDRRRSGFRKRIVRDPDGVALTTEFEVDDRGRVTRRDGPYGARTDYTWTDFDEHDTVTEPAVGPNDDRPTVTFEYDNTGRLVRRETQLLDHDAAELGGSPLVETFEYDRFGREIKRNRGPVSDPRKHARTRAYNRTNQVRRLTNWRGTITRREYDQRQRLSKVVRAVGTTDEFTVEREHDSVGRVVAETDGRGETTTREYDAFGRPAMVERPNGTTREFEHDAAGRRIRERLIGDPPNGGSPVTWSESTTEYNALGRAIREHAHLFDPTGGSGGRSPSHRKLTTTSVYDADGNLVETVDPTGASTTYAYDDLGRRIEQVGPEATSVTTDFDDANRVVTRTVERTGTGSDGSRTTQVSRTVRRLDEQGRPVAVVDSAGNERTISYDSRGNRAKEVDPMGTPYLSEYDIFGYKRADVDGGARISYERDELGAVRRVTDPLGNDTIVDRDPLGRVIRITRGEDTREYGYDDAGNRIRIEDENGAVRNRTFDAVGRLAVESVDRSGVTPPSDRPNYTPTTRGRREFTYTPAGSIAEARNADATVSREYDSLGRLVTDDVDGRRVDMSYDDVGRVEAITYQNGRRIEYTYSSSGVLESVQQTAVGTGYPGDGSMAANRQLLSADHVGERITRMDLQAVEATVTHEPRGLPVGADWSTDQGPLISERRLYDARDACRLAQFDGNRCLYTHDARGRLVRATTERGAGNLNVSSLTPPTSAAGIDMNGQQRLNTLTPNSSTTPDRELDYDLDANSNRLQRTETVDGTTTRTDYDVGAFNRYNRVDGTAQVHDRVGNLLDDGRHSYTYDVDDRLARISLPGGGTLSYERDPLGRLVSVDDGSSKRVFTYAGDRLVGWRSPGAGSADGHLVHARSSVCHAATGSTDYVPITDLEGSVRYWLDIANPTGNSANRRYGPFGTVQSSQGFWPVPIGYRGYIESGTDDLLGLGVRTYDPDRGRFLQHDPAGFTDGPNLYTYARHAPTALTDRSGFQSVNPTHGTPADTAAQSQTTDEWDYVGTGFLTTAGGALAVYAGYAGAVALAGSNPVGWAVAGAGLMASFGIASGTAGVTVGIIQMGASYYASDRQERLMARGVGAATSISGSPASLGTGTVGLLYTQRLSGMTRFANAAAALEGLYGIYTGVSSSGLTRTESLSSPKNTGATTRVPLESPAEQLSLKRARLPVGMNIFEDLLLPSIETTLPARAVLQDDPKQEGS